MKKYMIVILILILVVVGGIVLSMSLSPKQKFNNVNKVADMAKTISTDPQDIVPGLYTNLIKNISVISGFSIQSGLVENNIDQNGKTVDDHLELVLKNSSAKDMTDFEAYYTVTDLTTLKKEGYYKKLFGLTLKAGETKTIHFDNTIGENHFGLNKNGMYFTGQNKMQFDVEISMGEFKIATIQIAKDAGGAEQKD